MAQMIQSGKEIIRINFQKNSIEYSSDGGRNWHLRYSGSSHAGTFADLILFGSEVIACTSKGLYYSKDAGRNWHLRYSSSHTGSFLQLMADGSTLLATTSKGLYYSKDSGRNWHKR